MDKQQHPAGITRRLYARILQIMEKEKPYLDPRLTLPDLALLAGTNRTQLSSTLNRQTGRNFSRWLSSYRVNHLIEELDNHPELDTRDLYEKAGFPSRTSFYRQFKEITGKTLGEFLEERDTIPT